MSLRGRIAVVTGGGSGIGEAIARDLAASSAQVAIIDVSEENAQRVAAQIRADGIGTAIGVQADVGDRVAVDVAFGRVENELGPVDILVNNAGISIDRGLRRIGDDWDQTLHVNLTGVMLCAQQAAKIMVPRRQGRIVNISSRAWLGWWGQLSYASSKGGVVSATRALAIELSKHRITVNCVAPGLIDTPLLRREPPETLDRLRAAQPTGEIGTGDDVARAVRFFAAMTRPTVTGQILYVCGGKSLYARPSNRVE